MTGHPKSILTNPVHDEVIIRHMASNKPVSDRSQMQYHAFFVNPMNPSKEIW
jgi:hypothetical protein